MTGGEGYTFSIVFDDTSTRPSNGGTRLCAYADDRAAVAENVALARRMHLKHRLYNTGFSGGKIVVNAIPGQCSMPSLLADIGDELNRLDGAMYTGCDLNIGLADMRILSRTTPFILAGLGKPHDPNIATAMGVLGSVRAALGSAVCRELGRPSVLVVGCGQVGAPLARGLVERDAVRVFTSDLRSSRADVHGARNISGRDWSAGEFDVVVLCTGSGIVTDGLARTLRCRVLVSAANLPFACPRAARRIRARGTVVVPDVISNSGAVICDSVEHYAPDAFVRTASERIYGFVEHLVEAKTSHYLDEIGGHGGEDGLEAFFAEPGAFCGERFR